MAQLGVPRIVGDIIVERIGPMTPYLLELKGKPTVLVRLDGLPQAETGRVAKAVGESRCLLVAGFKLYSTYPILILSLQSPGE